MTVSSKDKIPAPVHFYLHETFGSNDVIPVAPNGNSARLELLVYGGFTVGAWIEGTDIKLELDLSKEINAPDVIRYE